MEVAKLNDELRRSIPFIPEPHRLILTDSLMDLSEETLEELFSAIRIFNTFNESNDPYKEHDMGLVEIDDQPYFWKFSYLDENFEFYRTNGARLLTIMRADEY